MLVTRSFETCPVCGKDIKFTESGTNYYKHLSLHNNPSSRLCTKWYKPYFTKVSANTSACTICDEELNHEVADSFSHHQYIDHLASHGITE